tara:strand:+ start:832 stop:999 length:168 start_codon:yes stop_codon:yes gene_type:complete
MPFSKEELSLAISNNDLVKDHVSQIKDSCQELQAKTGCPDEDIDSLLEFLIQNWK